MKNIGKIEKYLKYVLGLEFRNKTCSSLLPPPLNHFFEGRLCELAGQEYVLLQPAVTDVKLSILIQRIKTVESRLGKTCILIADSLNGTQRRQFIQNQICFIIPDRQIYLPTLGTFLTEKRLNAHKEIRHLTPAATFLLLYHLQKKSLEGMNFGEIAERLEYPPKTISVVVSQLEQMGICEIVAGTGKAKTLSFNHDARKLWEEILPLMSSPIQKVGYVQEEDIDKSEVAIAYDNALSYYTDVADLGQKCLAIYKRTAQADNLYDKATTTNYPGSVRLEFWKYNPLVLSTDGYIDPLSMILCYERDTDERVQGELQRLIDRIL